MFTELPVDNQPTVVPPPEGAFGMTPIALIMLIVFLAAAMYKLGGRNKHEELRRKALDQLLAKSGITLIEAAPLTPSETVEPVLPSKSAEPVQPVSPAPVMEAVLPTPVPQDEVAQHRDDEPASYAPVNRSHVFASEPHEPLPDVGLDIPHQSEEDWQEQERRRELRNQEITPEMEAEFEAMDADRK